MQHKIVLIITHSNDNNAIEEVSNVLAAQGITAVRFNTDLFPTKITIESYQNLKNEQILTLEDGKQYKLSDIGAIWYRRFHTGRDLPRDIEAQARKACFEESKRTLLGYFDALDVFKIDDYWTIRRASSKELQLIKARKHGIDIPDTLTTNNAEAVKKFYHKHQGAIISKMQTAFAIYNEGKESVVYTNPIKASDLEKLEQLNLCPMQFQEALTKELELRATVVGDKVFCIAIDSNKYQQENYDWRKKGSTTLEEWFSYPLPTKEQAKLIALTKDLGLNYGAADYILTPKGELKFLEINPCGEFYWAVKYQKQNICEALAHHLANNMN
ncbi:MvdC/MvdD family ATP grasp protein [Colwelliaceae bacterium MEBiC 14330]